MACDLLIRRANGTCCILSERADPASLADFLLTSATRADSVPLALGRVIACAGHTTLAS